jgi:tetratricopeptide (TPR) repeat protein
MAAELDDELTGRERMLYELIGGYYAAVAAGQAPDRQALLERNPELADSLAEFFVEQDRFHRATAPLREAALAAETEVDPNLTPPADHARTAATSQDVPWNPPLDGPPYLAPGDAVACFGDYELLGALARGGMGIVYRARQRSLNRPVALKMMLAGRHASADDIQRFKNEAEAAANLDHPHIVPVYEVGEHDGQSYLVMKLIEGASLAHLVGSGQWEVGGHDTSRRAAGLISTVARAVHHAHQRGVLHRDLKPSNILVDAQGQPYVTDFGLAKRVGGDIELTQSGAILGSPPYMAAEQATGCRGAVTTATDVYGLGAVLYALLTGRPPFQADSALETIEKVKACEPEPPSSINPRIDRDLETICLKCLQKVPQRRYASAQELADDLDRWLGGQPITARPVTRAERAWRWCRRNPAVAALTGAVASLAVMALVGLVVSNRTIARERVEAERQRDEARQAVDDMYTEVAEQWLAQQAALEPVQNKFLQKALEYYQRFAGIEATDPQVRLKTAVAYDRVGLIQERLGRHPEAEAAYRRGLSILKQLTTDSPLLPEYRSGLSSIQRNLGNMLRAEGQLVEGERLMRESTALNEKLAADSPAVPAYRSGLARSYQKLGRLLSSSGHFAEAERACRRAIELGEKLAADSPAVPEYRSDLVDSHNLLVKIVVETGRLPEAEPVGRRAVELGEKLAAEAPSVPEYRIALATAYANSAVALAKLGHPVEAGQALRQCIALQERLATDSPSVPGYRRNLANGQLNLGKVLDMTGQYAEAEQANRRAIALLEKLASDVPSVPEYRSLLAASHTNLGAALVRTGRRDEAEQSVRRTIALLEELTSDSPTVPEYRCDLAKNENNLAAVLEESGNHAEAEQRVRRAIWLSEKLSTESPSVPEYQWVQVISHLTLAGIMEHTARPAEAEQAHRKAIALVQKHGDPESQNEVCWSVATSSKHGLGVFRLALQLMVKVVEKEPRSALFWRTLGVAHYRVGDRKRAIDALEKSMQLPASDAPSGWFFLAMAHWQRGDESKARSWYDKAVQWMARNNSRDEELQRFRDEAEVLLGIADSRMPNGLDAFCKE